MGETTDDARRVVPLIEEIFMDPSDLPPTPPNTPNGNPLTREEIKRVVRRLETLPALPAVAARLLNLLTAEDADPEEVVDLLETDQAIVMRLLKLVNSSHHGLRSRVTTLSRAVMLLGLPQLRCALLSVTISESLIKELRKRSSEDQLALWKHALTCAVCAELAAEKVRPELKGEAFVAGLLHDVGKLILKECLPEDYRRAEKTASERGIPMVTAEQEMLGLDHPTVGKWLAERWHLPAKLVQPIWLHHHSLDVLNVLEFDEPVHRTLALLIRLADHLAHEIAVDYGTPSQLGTLDPGLPEALNLETGQLDAIRAEVGKRYSQRTALLDLEEDEVSFYFSALQRANRTLADIAWQASRLEELDRSFRDVLKLNELQISLARLEDREDVLETVVRELLLEQGGPEGILTLVSERGDHLVGRYWAAPRLQKTFLMRLWDGKRPDTRALGKLSPELAEFLERLPDRFPRPADLNPLETLVQYRKPYLALPLVVEGAFAGEIVLKEGGSLTAAAGDPERSILRYLASILSAAVSRCRLLEGQRRDGERLGLALSRAGRTMKELAETKQLLDALFEHSNDAVVLHDLKGRILRANARAAALTGLEGEALVGAKVYDLLEGDSAELRAELEGYAEAEGEMRREARLLTGGGESIEVEVCSRFVDRKRELVLTLLRDLRPSKSTAKALLEERDRLSVMLRSIAEGVIATDREGNVLLLNSEAERLTGWRERDILGKPARVALNLVDANTRRPVESPLVRVIENGCALEWPTDLLLLDKEGGMRPVAVSAAPIRDQEGRTTGVIVALRDLSLLRRMEQEILKSQKLESVGVLAGGIAHDFNNILMSILGNVNLAKMYADRPDKLHERLDEAELAVHRAKDLTRQLFTVSKGGAPIKRTAAIAEIVQESCGLALRGSNVVCEFDFPEDLWAVDVDPGQMNQVICNLIINAKQAMPRGGTVRIRGENVFVSSKHGLPLAAGKYLRLSVSDEGVGIPDHILPKIFDPYFTTKERGAEKGTGLGLAIVDSIIRSHGGHITVESSPGAGTTFHIYLPSSERKPPRTVKEKECGEVARGRGRILVMDDEEPVRTITRDMLSTLGYDVAAAASGEEAIEMYRVAMESGEPFAAVLLDLTVRGGLGAKGTIERLRELDPEVQAIVSSGYATDEIIHHYRDHGFSAMITKPYTIRKLSETLRLVLAGSERRTAQRKDVRCSVTISRRDHSVPGEMRNVSAKGAMVVAAEGMDPEEDVRMTIESEESPAVSVSGKVVWSRKNAEDTSNGPHCVGVRFENLSEEARDMLLRLVSRH